MELIEQKRISHCKVHILSSNHLFLFFFFFFFHSSFAVMLFWPFLPVWFNILAFYDHCFIIRIVFCDHHNHYHYFQIGIFAVYANIVYIVYFIHCFLKKINFLDQKRYWEILSQNVQKWFAVHKTISFSPPFQFSILQSLK